MVRVVDLPDAPRKPPEENSKRFDPIKACFYLIAFIIGSQVLVVMMGAFACAFYYDQIMTGHFQCDKDGRLDGLLSSALSAALAFAGGFTRNLPPPPPGPPGGPLPPRA